MYFIIKIELTDITNPKIWRRVKVPEDYTFHELHLVVQAAMGWRDSHLYRFFENSIYDLLAISSPHDETGLNAEILKIRNLLFQFHDSDFIDGKRKNLKYWYDYGDSWVHEIDVEKIILEDLQNAEIIAGEGACPPEDCGSVPGYEDIKESLRTGKPSEIHEESWVPWLEGCGYVDFDAEVYDIKAARKMLQKMGL